MTREPEEPLPAWLDLALWFDLSPVRPWEWAGIPADSWTEAVQVRDAWAAGQADARDEAAMNERLAKMESVA